MENSKTKILAIDDNKDNLISLKALINEAFPNVLFFTAQSGEKGIELAKSEMPDVIILDIIMPEMDGYEVCKRLKADDSIMHIPILMVTAIKTDAQSRVKGLNLGADAFLSKPIDHIELTAQVNVMLRIKRAEDKLRDEKKDLEELVLERTYDLKDSEVKYKALYENSPLPYQSLNEDGSFIDVNPTWLSILGYKREEVIGKFYKDFLHPDYKPHFEKNFEAFKKRGYVNDVQFEIRHKDSHYRYISFEGCISYHPDGSVKQTYCVFQDITERKIAETKLIQSEERLKMIAESTKEWIWEVDTNGLYTYSSDIIEQLIGYSPEEIVGKKYFYDTFLPEEKEELKNAAFEVFNQKNTFREFINRNITKNGEIIWLLSSGFPMLDDNGNLLGFRGVDVDITKKKQAELQLKESEEFSRYLLQTIPFGMDIVDADGTILFQNDKLKKHFGEEAIGEKCWELYRDDKAQCFDCPLVTGIEVGTTELYESKGVLGGKTFDVVHTGIIYKGKEALLEIFIDITDRKLAENELIEAKNKAEESDRLKSAFLANMSHEIRTPMNGIMGFAELLKSPNLSGDQQQEYIGIIEKSGDRMLKIINDIIDISKIEAGLMTLEISESNINDQIEYIYTFFKPEVEAKGMKLLFKNSLPANEAVINTDREKIFAILTNLVKNAIKFSRNGFIEFGYEIVKEKQTDASMLQFYVKDTGKGIPDEKKDVIFTRFMQAGKSYDINREGTGLGLSISKAYVQLLGGKIWVDTEEGKGSTFYFTIPYITTYADTVDAKNLDSQSIESEKLKLNVLIAEDDDVSEMLLSIHVNEFSNSVIKVKTGVETVEACRNNPDIDLILMDIQMPIMSGYEATRQIRKFNEDVIIIAQTAFGLSGDREKALEAGCNDYITKPINKIELQSLVQNYFIK